MNINRTKILVISAHSFSLDRRIIAQVNSLVEFGYHVTLVSIPIYDDCSDLIDSRVEKVIPFIKDANKNSIFHRIFLFFRNKIIKYSPELLLTIVRFCRLKFYYSRYFFSIIPKEKYQIIHAHDLVTLPIAIKIKNQISVNSKIVFDAHELYPYQFKCSIERKLWLSLEKHCLNFVDQIITINDSCKRYFKDNYPISKAIDIIFNSYYCPLENHKVVNIKEKFFNQDLPIFLFQGGLSLGRNLENVVTAFAQLNGIANLLILGRGELLQKLKQLIKIYNAKNIFHMDWINQDELPGVLRQVDFGIIPYLFNNNINTLYCTPNKLFEFISFKIPILANNLPEINQIIKKYKIGYVTDLTLVDNIKDGIKSIITQNFYNANFLNTGLEWEVQKENLFKIYTNLIQG